MATIKQLSEADIVENGDQFPFFSEAQGDTRKVTFATLKDSVATDFVSAADLAAQTGATLVGCNGGTTVQQELDAKVSATLDTDGTLAANSDARVASQKATKAYADAKSTALAASSGSSLVGFIQSGTGAVAETVQDAVRRVVYAAQYGAAPAASAATNSTAISNAIAEIVTRGGGDVILPSGEVSISSTIDITTSNVRLIGAGGDTSHGAGTNMTQKTVLKWAGSAGGKMIRFRTPYGATAQRRYGMGLSRVELSGESLAAIGLEVDSISGAIFENIHIRHCTTTQYNLICGQAGVDGPAGEALDVQLCRFSRCTYDTRDTGFSATSAKGWFLDGSANANVSGNRFEMCSGIYSNGPGFDLTRADNNVFERCSGFRVGGSGTVYTFDLKGTLGGGNIGAYANLFLQCGWDATYGMTMSASNGADSINVRVNMVIGYDEANGGGPPVVGTNSRITYLSKAGVLSDITRTVLRQSAASPNSGYTTYESSNRHDDWVSGANFNHTGDGFARTDVFHNVNVISAVGAYKCDGVQVVQTRKTGWSAATGSATRSTFDTTTVTTQQLAERVKALVDDLISHGLIGA